MIYKPVSIPKEKRKDFYQSKYDHFKYLLLWVIIISCLIEMTFFVSDCSVVMGFSENTLLSRFLIIVPLGLYLFAFKHVSSYKIMVPFSYVMIHACMLSVIWTSYYISNVQNLRESFLVIQIMFLIVGIASPKKLHCIFHALMIAEIVLACMFNSFTGIDTLISLDGACLIAICAFEFIFESAFGEMYNAQMKLEDVALHDQLTGAFNRSKLKMLCMEDTSELVFRNAGFILLDIDEFKKINESFGHDTGDQIIKELYNIIKICTRGDDVCIRLGGEQFLIIVPNQGLARTKEIGERIRHHVENKKDLACTFRISVGATVYKGGDYHVSINFADKALKFAKENEVNLVVAYEDM
ncbi:MAG: GGDEF domain-containing protein [Lachnospiraceae bacterium]|nr:GGDEF domain-containing protein [Lachnospiraceae bacterium]